MSIKYCMTAIGRMFYNSETRNAIILQPYENYRIMKIDHPGFLGEEEIPLESDRFEGFYKSLMNHEPIWGQWALLVLEALGDQVIHGHGLSLTELPRKNLEQIFH